jgi:outer membrane protein OmpA-like peptidoglycan-associated protein
VKGKEKKTVAFNSSFTGVDANPISKLGKHQLIRGEAATLDGDGLFDFDKGVLTPKGIAQVKAVVANLRGADTIHCEGYTDYAGELNHELELSLIRAKAVCTALKHYGADVTTMTRGYGPKRPAVVGGTPKSRKENRRVVILITG